MTKLYRSKAERKISGICGGIGEIFNTDPNIIRLAAIFLCILTGIVPLVLTYIIGTLLIPED